MALEIPPAFCFQDLTLFIPTPLVAWWPFWVWIERFWRSGISWLESFTQLHSLGRWRRWRAERHELTCIAASLAECCIYKKKHVLMILDACTDPEPKTHTQQVPRGESEFSLQEDYRTYWIFAALKFRSAEFISVRVSWVSCSTFLNAGSLRALQLGRKRFVPWKTQRWSDWQCSHPFAFTALTSVVKPLRLNQSTGALDWQIAVCHVVYYVVPAACSMVL